MESTDVENSGTEQRVYQIKRTFIVPLSILLTLSGVLFAVVIMQGQPIAKALILVAIIFPVFVLLLESLFREIQVDDKGITLKKLLRQKRFEYEDVTAFDLIVVKKRAFASISTEEDFLLFSNAYAEFPALLKQLQKHIPEDKVAEESVELLAAPPEKSSDIVSCWVAVVLLLIIIVVQF